MSASPGPNLFNQLINSQMNARANCLFPSMLFRERLKIARNLYKTDLVGHYGCVNAIEFSNGGKYLVSGGDDKRVLLWDVEKSLAGYETPIAMDKEHQSNIFCLGFDKTNSKIFSGGNDEMVIVHDFETRKVVDVFLHQKPVYGLSVDPTCDSILATASEDGKITIYDQRKSAAVQIFGKFGGSRQASFHAVQFHPYDGNFLVTANTRKGAAFWDIRSTSKPLIQYGGEENQKSCMSVRFNSNGTLVLALRRRLPPILYNTSSETPICQFYHPDYYNSCTMKSCCFAGEDDEFVLSGSDDFNLYVWRVGDVDLNQSHQWIEKTQMVLYGHRSIVNQVRYNAEKCVLASSGVEKIIKIWSPFEQKEWNGSLVEEATASENPRQVFSLDAYLSLASANMSHDYSTQNTAEDSRMMAFFDSLIQQEIEQWNTTTYSSDSCQFSNDSSDAQSTRHSSTDDSDADQNINSFFTNSRNRNRRGSVASIKPQRNKYTNRIAYLIATKRNTLRRLALKGASNSRRRQNILKTKKKTHHHRSNPNPGVRTSRSGNSQKRTGRYMSSVSFRNRTGSTNSNNPENSDLKKMRQRRYDAVFRALKRKHRSRRHIDPSDTSSDDDDDADVNFNYEPPRATNIAIPSTSTGITSSGRDIIIRLRQQEQLLDSEYYDDDDDEEETTNANTSANPASGSNVAVPNNVQNVTLNGRNNSHNNNIMNNNNRNYNNVNNGNTNRSAPIESDVSSSNVETDPEDRQNNNHFNNNTDMINNNIAATANATNDIPVLVINNNENNQIINQNGHSEYHNDNDGDDNDSINNSNSNDNQMNANESTSNNNNFNTSSISSRLSRKRLAPDISINGEASSSSSFTGHNSNRNSIKKVNVNRNSYTNSSNRNLDIYSSHSNSRLSNSDYLDDDSNSLSNESLDCFIGNGSKNKYDSPVGFSKKRKISLIDDDIGTSPLQSTANNNNTNSTNNSDNNMGENNRNGIYDDKQAVDDDDEDDHINDIQHYYSSLNTNTHTKSEANRTPKNANKFNGFSRTFVPVTPDSGINTTAGCSSVTSTSSIGSVGHNKSHNNVITSLDIDTENVNNVDNDNNISLGRHNINLNSNNSTNGNMDKFAIKLFHQKVAKVRRNYRKKFADDSESD